MPPPKKPKNAAGNSGPKVRVRMYRQGLGDCFLITMDPGPKEQHLLIDCGSLGATTTGVSLEEVVDHIRQTTHNHLALLVVTHEHQDHLSGFRHFKKAPAIKVDQVWLAWTENPADPLAKDIAKYKHDLGIALAAGAKALTRPGRDHATAALGRTIQDVLGFAGDTQVAAASDFSKTVDEAMDFIQNGLGVTPRFLNPGGAAIQDKSIPGFRFYVLGPPRSKAALQNLGEHGSPDLYHLVSGLAVGAALAAGEAVGEDEREAEMPFDVRYRLAPDDPQLQSSGVWKNYANDSNAWRRVDQDWLRAAADLALQLDSLTNNTSLALAIERVSDGKVLLFPADAQQGNWLSWHEPNMKWKVRSGNTVREVTATELLQRTVFYKVGHHASHNATASRKGLELMKDRDLIAFIPVDRAVALNRSPKDKWQMPAKPLYKALLQHCQGRVARSDIGWAEDAAKATNKEAEKEFKNLADEPTWAKWKKAQDQAKLQSDRLFLEVTL
jgi:hypothetical protein